MRLASILALSAVGSSAFQRGCVGGGKAIHSWETPTDINTIAMDDAATDEARRLAEAPTTAAIREAYAREQAAAQDAPRPAVAAPAAPDNLELFGVSILDGLAGLGPFVETAVPQGAEPSASEADIRGPTELKTCIEALRAGGGKATEKYDGVGLAVLEDMPELPLSYERLNALILCAMASQVREGRAPRAQRMDYEGHESMRTFVPISFGSRHQTGRAAELWQAIVKMADGGDGDAKILVKWKEDAAPVVSKASVQSMETKSGTAVHMDDGGRSSTHGDGAHFRARTVTVVMKKPHATKRVSIGLCKDDRQGGSRRLLHPSEWIYLGDLVLRNKETYIGDAVTMGGERVGGGGAASSALVHRVNPVEGAEWVLIIDWFPVA